MTTKKLLATCALVPWVMTVAFVLGPVRWEVAHTYQHLVGAAPFELPILTLKLSLPILGIAPDSLSAGITAFTVFALIWLGLAALLTLIWRAQTPDDLVERFIFGSALYFGLVIFVLSVVMTGLALPFMYL